MFHSTHRIGKRIPIERYTDRIGERTKIERYTDSIGERIQIERYTDEVIRWKVYRKRDTRTA